MRVSACAALAISRATSYRLRSRQIKTTAQGPFTSLSKEEKYRNTTTVRKSSCRSLSPHEQQHVLTTLYSEEYADKASRQVYADLLSQGTYLCSVRTMYRLLAVQGQSRERRAQRSHPPRQAPKLKASKPNQVWSWDITKLRGPVTGKLFFLYVILEASEP